MLSVFVIISYSLCSSSFCGFLVFEREFKLKYALNVMGCRSYPYWIGTFVFDYLMYLLTLVFFFGFGLALGISYMIEHLGQMIYIMLAFGLTLISWGHLSNFMFNSATTAFKFIVWINFFLLYGVVMLLTLIPNVAVFTIVSCLFPFVAL